MLRFRWETEFKETEIGEIPRDWEVYPLGEVVEDAIVGSTPLKKISKYWTNGTIPWLTNKEVEYGKINYIEDTEEKVNVIALEETNLKLVPPNSLIISFTASVGKVVINKVPITTNQQFISFVLKSIPDTVKYLGYFFLLNRELIESFSGATPFNFITKEKALQIPIIFPPLSEQSRIATVLSWFDDLIEVKKRQNEILEKTAMAIFKSWFIDFEPFRDGKFVYIEELGKEIPKGWEVKRLYELCKILRGLNFKSNEVIFEYAKGYIPVLRTNNIKGGFEIDFSDLMFVKEDKINPEKLLKENDILLSASNGNPELVGNFAVFLNTFTDLTFSFGAFIYLIRVNNHEMFPYVYLSLSDNSFREYVASAISGTNINNLNLSDLKNFPVLIPPSHILQSFHSLVEPLFQKIILNQKQIMTLRKIRDTLLPLLVFGKLRVEEV
ncbi:restriction endonuclease subunit S [Thermocrinis sp.]|uniref:restriction endonuclease subunit S n=1 Tax=Thermocrinis sp. TaxID=2024383 RepID=UPI003BFDEC12